jgi:ABC-type sugar transport system permease subunit
MLMLPAMIFIVLFLLYPIGMGVVMSFQKTTLAGAVSFTGFNNYYLLFTEGGRFFQNLLLSLLYVVFNLALTLPFAYLTAILITKPGRIANFFRTIYLIPWITAPIASTLMVKTMLDPDNGLISVIVKAITHQDVMILNNGRLALLVIVLHSFWRSFPYVMLFLSAGMAGIPNDLYEAAKVDGAGKIYQFFHITVPLTVNQLGFAAVQIVIWTLNDSESVYALTQGGPGRATETLAVRIFKAAFNNMDYNMAASMGLLLTLVSAIFMAINLRYIMRGADYE